MDTKLFATVFTTVFLAELGDKTQLATVLFSARSPGSRWTVFAASAGGLVLASAIGVLAGDFIARNLDTQLLTRIAGVAFVVIGIWTFARA
jgi:putative Ca2+/H+ antiporter (TMEM165/GDT1 family)